MLKKVTALKRSFTWAHVNKIQITEQMPEDYLLQAKSKQFLNLETEYVSIKTSVQI